VLDASALVLDPDVASSDPLSAAADELICAVVLDAVVLVLVLVLVLDEVVPSPSLPAGELLQAASTSRARSIFRNATPGTGAGTPRCRARTRSCPSTCTAR
jgi:hypothetical protein